MLHEYLLELRRHGSAEPISERLTRRVPEPDRALAEHVRSVAHGEGLPPPGRSEGAGGRGGGVSADACPSHPAVSPAAG